MSDLIDRQAAIEAIASRDKTDGTVKVFTGREVNGILAGLPTANQWIPCSERFPEDEQPVIFSTKTGRVHQGKYHLISRQAAIDALRKLREEVNQDHLDRATFAIKQLPPIQPEIVRCKDCKYAEYIDDVRTLWCTECGQGRTVAPNDFCSYAERRTE